jgi:hypothetical protein
VGTANHDTWVRNALLSLAVLAVLAFAFHSLGFSDAAFTSGSVNPANVFTAGDLRLTNDRDGLVMIDASDLVPGSSSAGTVTLTGSGDISGTYTLGASGLTDSPNTPRLSEALTLTVEDVSDAPVTLYQGSVATFSSVDLGTIAPGVSRIYRLTLAYPQGANDAALQGATMTLDLGITGVST